VFAFGVVAEAVALVDLLLPHKILLAVLVAVAVQGLV
jgi:hypothetical protein